MTRLVALALIASVVAALVGGVFFAFSSFVMRALADQPGTQGIAAMQSINVTVINPLFMGMLFGEVPLLGVAAYLARSAGHARPFAWLAAAFVIYLVGTIIVTIAFNVPQNERLAQLPFDSAEAAAYWPVYVREWLVWNHVRCVASLAAAAAAAFALVGVHDGTATP